MATSPKATEGKTIKQCPQCGATVFQGPYARGPIENGKLVARETLYQCVNCHRVAVLAEIGDHETEVPLVE